MNDLEEESSIEQDVPYGLLLCRNKVLSQRIAELEAENKRLKQPDYYWLDGDTDYSTEDIYDIIQDEMCIDAGGEAFIDIAGARSTGTVRYRVTAKEGTYGLDYEYEALNQQEES